MKRMAVEPIPKMLQKRLKELIERGEAYLNNDDIDNQFFIVGQLALPDDENGLNEPHLKVVFLTNERAKNAKETIQNMWSEEITHSAINE